MIESVISHQKPELSHVSVNWRAIFAGLFVSLLVYMLMMTLGLAIGGSQLTSVIQNNQNAGGLGIGSAIWLVVSAVTSLFAGSYTAGHSAGQIPARIGRTQGYVIAGLFFVFLFSQLGGALGTLGKGVGSLGGALSSATGDLSKNPQIQDTLESALSDQANLKSSPGTVAQGLAGRLLRGDDAGARSYLAQQTGMTSAQADQKLTQLKGDFQGKLKTVGASTAKAVSIAGWTLFGMLLLCALSAMLGGAAGARASLLIPTDLIKQEPAPLIRKVG